MFTVEKSIFINRPQEEVFDYATNPENVHIWQSQILSAKWISKEKHMIGSTQHSVARFMGRELESDSEITLWNPPERYSFKVISGPFPLEGDMKFESEGNGTKATMGGQVEAAGFFKLAENIVKKQIEGQFISNLEALKHLMETDVK